MPKVKKLVLLLAPLVLLTGCLKTLPLVVTVEELCKDWRHKTVSKQDRLTEQTASDLEADNKSRPNWGCEYGANKAKS